MYIGTVIYIRDRDVYVNRFFPVGLETIYPLVLILLSNGGLFWITYIFIRIY